VFPPATKLVPLALCAVIAVATASAAPGERPRGPAACAPGATPALIAGKRACLAAGRRCRARHDRRYHRHGFHCHGRRLTERPTYEVTSAGGGTPVGVSFHCLWPNYDDRLRAHVLRKLAAAGITWVRMDVSWARVEDVEKGARNTGYVRLLDRCVAMTLAHGLHPLVVVLGTPAWANGSRGSEPPADASDFRDFMHWAAERYRQRVPAWQIYNEPNSTAFWTGTVAEYAAVLRAGFEGVKSGDPTATVVTGGIAFNDDAWVQELYANGARDHFDVLATHPYQAKGDEPPERPDDGHKWWFTHTPAVRQVMLDHDDADAKIWITEFAYSAHGNDSVPPGSDFFWALGVGEREQADYAVRALDHARRNWPFVELFAWYKDISWPLGGVSPDWFDLHSQSSGLLRADRSERPVYRALKAYLLRGEQAGPGDARAS
jgi:hypothetical protein